MPKKGLPGQLSMFDFWNEQPADGEVEMVSLMPDEVEVPKIAVEPQKITKLEDIELPVETKETEGSGEVVMHAEKRDASGQILAEISYRNYNKVFLRREGEEEEIHAFDNSKEAVDFYIDEAIKLGCFAES